MGKIKDQRSITKDHQALTEEWKDYADKPWIVDFCDDTDRCLSPLNRWGCLLPVLSVLDMKISFIERDLWDAYEESQSTCIRKLKLLCPTLGYVSDRTYYPEWSAQVIHRQEAKNRKQVVVVYVFKFIIFRRKLSAMLAGLVNVGTVKCVHGEADELCEVLGRWEREIEDQLKYLAKLDLGFWERLLISP